MYAFCKALGVSPNEYYETSMEDVSDIITTHKIFNDIREEKHNEKIRSMR